MGAGCAPGREPGREPAAPPPAPLPEFDAWWDYGNPAATEAKFRELLPRAEASASAGYRAELLTQIARCQGLQDQFDAANATLDRVDRMLQPATGQPDTRPDLRRARVRYLLERGRVFNSGGQPAKALPLFEQAWGLGHSSGETRLAIDALHMVALAQPDPARKVEWNLKGIAAVQQAPSERGWLKPFYNNLGEAYAEQGKYEDALKAFRELSALDASRGRPADPYTQKDIAKMLRKLGRVDEAMTVIRPLHDDLERRGRADGWIDEELAECLLARPKPNPSSAGHTRRLRTTLGRRSTSRRSWSALSEWQGSSALQP